MGIERLKPVCLGNLLANVNNFLSAPFPPPLIEGILTIPSPRPMVSKSCAAPGKKHFCYTKYGKNVKEHA